MKERIITAILGSLIVSFVVMFIVIGFNWVVRKQIIWNSFHTRLSIFAFVIFFIMGLIIYKGDSK